MNEKIIIVWKNIQFIIFFIPALIFYFGFIVTMAAPGLVGLSGVYEDKMHEVYAYLTGGTLSTLGLYGFIANYETIIKDFSKRSLIIGFLLLFGVICVLYKASNCYFLDSRGCNVSTTVVYTYFSVYALHCYIVLLIPFHFKNKSFLFRSKK